MSDEKFLNTSKEDLITIKNKTSLNSYISDETKEKLKDIDDKDVKKFIENHLLKNAF